MNVFFARSFQRAEAEGGDGSTVHGRPPVGGVDLPERIRRVELPGLRSRMLDTMEAVRTTRRTSLRQALTRCVCRMVSGVAGHGNNKSVEVAKRLRKGRWRGTWLLSKFREQRGVFRARATTF